ncbi:hypothetical protein [Indiicoccus explosivorum]|uniref:hypothetical protein n=1 Tax=Indiicoccus explosivorum TaxID=1917864 RepID=UPI0012D81858|nr:hypothetical protein [Indiicoccus explosivorum]
MAQEFESRKERYEAVIRRKRARIVSAEIGLSPDTERLLSLKREVLEKVSRRRIVLRRE